MDAIPYWIITRLDTVSLVIGSPHKRTYFTLSFLVPDGKLTDPYYIYFILRIYSMFSDVICECLDIASCIASLFTVIDKSHMICCFSIHPGKYVIVSSKDSSRNTMLVL